MAKVSFDGESKLITILSGVTVLDAQTEIYSAWKDWVMLDDNAKWLPAFRTFGGDQTAESQFAPRYFFLINGWKMEAVDVSVIVQTNLYSDDGLSPFIITNSAITNRTSDVPVIKSAIEQRLDYGDRVYYDQTSIYNELDYPNGTIAQPINNIINAIQIANNYNIFKFYILSNATDSGLSGVTFHDWHFYGTKSGINIDLHNNKFIDVTFENLIIDADLDNGSGYVINSTVKNLLNIRGEIKNSQLLNKILVYEDLVVASCYSGISGIESPIIDMREGVDTTLSVRAYSGGMEILYCDTPDSKATIELIAGHIILDETCIDGIIDIRGVGYLTDNSNGTKVITTGFVDSFGNYADDTNETNKILAYDDEVYYDETSTYTGVDYPVGTIAQPVNNTSDVTDIASKYNIVRLNMMTDILNTSGPGHTFYDWNFIAVRQNIGFRADENRFINIVIEDAIVNSDIHDGSCKIVNCKIERMLNISGEIKESQLLGTISIYEMVVISDCYSGISGLDSPIIDMREDSDTSLSLRSYSGGIKILNCDTSDSKATIELIAGHVILDETCTDGIIDIRGVGYLTDNSNGTTVITTGFVNSFGSYLEKTEELNQILAYDNVIFYDEIDGVSGSTYPIGTYKYPVNNMIDITNLVVIETNIRTIISKNDMTVVGIPVHVTGLHLKAETINTNLNIIEGEKVFNNSVEGFNITNGDLTGHNNNIINCNIVELYNFNGTMKDSVIENILTVHTNATIDNCSTSTDNSIIKPSIDALNGSKIIFNDFSGNLIIDDMLNVNDNIIINLNSGKITITNNCINGNLDIRGVGYIIDNSNGTNIITDGFITKQSLDLTEISSDIKRILGLTQENFRISGHVYDGDDKLESAIVYTYSSSSDTINGINPIATYQMTALYDTSGRLIDYKMIKS